jgi:hypothetical protein
MRGGGCTSHAFGKPRAAGELVLDPRAQVGAPRQQRFRLSLGGLLALPEEEGDHGVIDATLLGQTTAELMEQMESGDAPEGAQISEVFVIAAVTWPIDENEEGQSVFYRCSSARSWVQRGLLLDAARGIEQNIHPWEDDG